MKYIGFIIIIILYAVALQQNDFRFASNLWPYASTINDEAPKTDGSERPYFAEYFVNDASTNPMSHVSSLAPLGNNKILCTWYSGTAEGAKDVAIYSAIFDENKKTWSTPQKLMDREQASKELKRYVRKVGNALVLNDQAGRIWLFYSSVFIGGWGASSINYKISKDNGITWSTSKKLILSPFLNLTHNIKNNGLLVKSGGFFLPIYQEFFNKFSELVFIHADGDEVKYSIRKMPHEMRSIQPSLIYKGGQKIVAFFRNMQKVQEKYVLTATSNDLGVTWSSLENTNMPNPNSGFDCFEDSRGNCYSMINNSFKDRTNLSLMTLNNDTKSWKLLKTLEETSDSDDEYSYPFMISAPGGLFHTTYTYERRKIKHIVFNEAWLKKIGKGND